MVERIKTTRILWAAGAFAALVALVPGGGTASAGARDRFGALRAATAAADTESANWAGYAVTSTSTTYTSVTASWKEPTVTCGPSDAGKQSAFWVGLGGYSQSSQELEQVGTSADCDSTTGEPTYYAWYELVPSASVTIKTLKIKPGNRITTSVNVVGSGSTVELQVIDRSTGKRYTTELPFATPDTSSAEWIAEAPSLCDQYRCDPTPLADFGTIQFTNIAARGNEVGGTLTANPGWTTTSIALVPDSAHSGFYPGRYSYGGTDSAGAGASPSDASTDGRSFSVSWSASAAS